MRPGMLLVLQYPRRSQVTPSFLCVGRQQGPSLYMEFGWLPNLYFGGRYPAERWGMSN